MKKKMMNEEEKKQIMFVSTQGFYNIMWGLQTEIVQLWNMSIPDTYNRIKQLFIHVHAHLKESKVKEILQVDDVKDYFIPKFKEIEKIVYDPMIEKYTNRAMFKKFRNYKLASDKLFSIYMDLKRMIKESGLEVFYGVSQDFLIRQKQDANINKVFGRNK